MICGVLERRNPGPVGRDRGCWTLSLSNQLVSSPRDMKRVLFSKG